MEVQRSQMKLVIALIFLALAILIIKPFIISIIFAAIIAYLCYPLHKRLCQKLGENISATLITIAVLIIVILLIYHGVNLILSEFANFYVFISKINLEYFGPTIKEFSQIITSKLIATISDQISAILHLMLSLTIFFVALFYFLKEGKQLVDWIVKSVPFGSEQKKEILSDIKKNADAFIYVQVVIGLAQGVIATIGFYLLGLPYPLLAGLLAIILSILPVLGPYLLYIPVSMLVYSQYGLNIALAILIYGLTLGSIMDYVARPVFYGKKIKLHPVITFLGVFGGIELIGVVGIVIGPILLSISISLLKGLRIKNG